MKKTQNTSDNKKRLDLLRRTASEVRSYRVQLRILTVLLVMLILITGILYLTSVLYEKSGSFTVSIPKYAKKIGIVTSVPLSIAQSSNVDSMVGTSEPPPPPPAPPARPARRGRARPAQGPCRRAT